YVFFFSGRRRHTRSTRDWSSDVCSSDLEDLAKKLEPDFWANSLKADTDSLKRLTDGGMEVVQVPPAMMKDFQGKTAPLQEAFLKIGRASCRERVQVEVVRIVFIQTRRER